MNKIREILECCCDTSYLNHVSYVTFILAEILLLLNISSIPIWAVILVFGIHFFSMVGIGYVKEHSQNEMRYATIFIVLNGALVVICMFIIGIFNSVVIFTIPVLGYGIVTLLCQKNSLDKLVSHNTVCMRLMKGLPMMTGLVIYFVLFSIIIISLVISPMPPLCKIIGFILYVAFLRPVMISADHGMTILSIIKS